MTARRSLSKEETVFIKTVWRYYKAHGRHDLPWRKTTNPYRILVSELMLQQTQVVRVLPKYQAFLKLFPTARRLAAAPLGDVLTAWQGLGYNRRAKFLWQTAQVVEKEHRGKWATTLAGLRVLPGIGAYTAGAVMNFAYNQPIPLIETNIRTVYLHHFFHDSHGVADADLLPLIERTLDRENPREWNWALMDYGAYLKTTVGNINTRSRTYKKQSPFKESNRYVRGAILRTLSTGRCTKAALFKQLADIEKERGELALAALQNEGLVVKDKNNYRLP
jgi:A/G-specific adenine glycosylase